MCKMRLGPKTVKTVGLFIVPKLGSNLTAEVNEMRKQSSGIAEKNAKWRQENVQVSAKMEVVWKLFHRLESSPHK